MNALAKSKRTLVPEAEGRPFTFWFSTTSDAQKADSNAQGVFAALEAHVAVCVKPRRGG